MVEPISSNITPSTSPLNRIPSMIKGDTSESKTDRTAQEVLTVQTDHTRCWSCSKKVGLLGFKCKCSYLFCSRHRHSSDHNCTFNYKEEHKQFLIKNNPKVEAPKAPPM